MLKQIGNEFKNQYVEIEISLNNNSNKKVYGKLLNVDKSSHGSLGNIILESFNKRRLIIRGNSTKIIRLLKPCPYLKPTENGDGFDCRLDRELACRLETKFGDGYEIECLDFQCQNKITVKA